MAQRNEEGGKPNGDYLIDACSLLNLFGSRRCEEILRVIPGACAIVDRVAQEAIYVFRGGDGPDARERERVDIEPLRQVGLLRGIGVETDAEAATFVALAAELDDGEALTCALAIHRGAAVVTDDRKALNLLRARAPDVDVFTTSQLVRRWAETNSVTAAAVRAALLDIQDRARFIPSRSDPLYVWWQDAAGRATP